MSIYLYQRTDPLPTTQKTLAVNSAIVTMLQDFISGLPSGWSVASQNIPAPLDTSQSFSFQVITEEGFRLKFDTGTPYNLNSSTSLNITLISAEGITITTLDSVGNAVFYGSTQVTCGLRIDNYKSIDAYNAYFLGVPNLITSGFAALKLKNKVGAEVPDWVIFNSNTISYMYSGTGTSFAYSYLTINGSNNQHITYDPVLMSSANSTLIGTIPGVVGVGNTLNELTEYTVDGNLHIALNSKLLIPIIP